MVLKIGSILCRFCSAGFSFVRKGTQYRLTNKRFSQIFDLTERNKWEFYDKTEKNAVTCVTIGGTSVTDMLKAKDGEFFFSNWLRNRNTIEFLGIWERLMNPNFNCAEFDIIKSQAGLTVSVALLR